MTRRPTAPQPPVLRLARIAASKCWINDPAIDRDDLVQTAALAILRAPELPPGLAVFRGRAYISDLRRSNQVRRRQEQETLPTTYEVARAEDHVQAVAEEDTHDAIRSCPALTKQQRIVIGDLLEGYTQAEIAKRRGISPQGISNQVRIAVNALRTHFGLPSVSSVRMGRGRKAL